MHHFFVIQFKTAIDTYREAMSVWKSHEENFVCDRMQVSVVIAWYVPTAVDYLCDGMYSEFTQWRI